MNVCIRYVCELHVVLVRMYSLCYMRLRRHLRVRAHGYFDEWFTSRIVTVP